LGEDAELVNQVVLEEGEEDVSGPVEEGAGFEEDEEQPTEGDLIGGGRLSGDPSPSGEWGDAEDTWLDGGANDEDGGSAESEECQFVDPDQVGGRGGDADGGGEPAFESGSVPVR